MYQVKESEESIRQDKSNNILYNNIEFHISIENYGQNRIC